jgi:hypothetical protein
MNEDERILVEVAASEWACFIPLRSWESPRPANVREARQTFREAGVLLAGGGAELERKRRSLALRRLAAEGVLTVQHYKSAKAPAVLLADATRERTRRLAGQPGEFSAWLSMKELARHSTREPKLLLDAWVSETKLITSPLPPGRSWGREAALVEDLMAIALISGWVVSNSDVNGHVSYALTSSGWGRLQGDAPGYDMDSPIDPEAARWYEERLKAALARLDTAAPSDPRRIDPLMLPASPAGMPYGPPWLAT